MRFPILHPQAGHAKPARDQRGSILIIVLWIAFGLVSLALYFGHSTLFEYRAADNAVAEVEAEKAIESATRYLAYTLTNLVGTGYTLPGTMPSLEYYDYEDVAVGDGAFWLIGRSFDNPDIQADEPTFGLIDEASKLNLNTVTLAMIELLPNMTPELAAAIIDWRDADDEVSTNGVEVDGYLRLPVPYVPKNGPFETAEELRMVYGMTPELLYGEDFNRNGVLDENENDGDGSPPYDAGDGTLNLGFLEYFTAYSREVNMRTNGQPRLNVNAAGGTNLTQLLQERFGDGATDIQAQFTMAGTNNTSLLQFFANSGMTIENFAMIEGDLTVSNTPYVDGLVNVNTASAEVLACLPGLNVDIAHAIVEARRDRLSTDIPTVAWLINVLDTTTIQTVGPYLTSRSYQFTADLAAVGHFGRGYRRALIVIDTTEDRAKVIYRRDLSGLGWALGATVRENLDTMNVSDRASR